MSNEELKNHILTLLPEAVFPEQEGSFDCTVPSGKILALCQSLKENKETHFDFLFCQTGVDWPEEDYMTVVYHLRSTVHGHELVLKAKIEGREKPEIDTVEGVWKTAEFHEREIFDLFGIVFKGHPDLRRIFLDDDWVGYPMRKDYVDEVNIVEL